jgi:hypothetical protein
VTIHPRQRILDVWRSVLAASFQDGTWVWGGKDDSNSISDAEQLLCLLYPATAIPSLCIDRPDVITADVLKTLRPLGDGVRIPRTITNLIEDYMTRYTNEKGEPVFAGGSYFRNSDHQNGGASKQPAITEEQRALDIVDGYSMSVTLCLSALGFIKVFGPLISGAPRLKTKVGKLEQMVSSRLTAAMVGLLRSFVVNTIEVDEPPGRVMLRTVNQVGAAEATVLEGLRLSLSRIRSMLRDDVRIGVTPEIEDALGNDELLFECGWTWSIAHNAAPVEFVDKEIAKRPGIADGRPYLYFTVLALDGIVDLGSQRTRELGLLDVDQRRLADALQIRWDLTQSYWSTIARFGNQRWPLEDIPWRTSDGEESDYYSLLVSAVLVQDLINRQGTDDDLKRAVEVFEELARRGRITRRVMKVDPAVALHVPGVSLKLKGGSQTASVGPQLYWRVADFAPLLLKRSLQAAQLATNVSARDRLMLLAEATMGHLLRRRLTAGKATGLWDAPAEVFLPSKFEPPQGRASWYITSRVIEGLVTAAKTFEGLPLCNQDTISGALNLLNEAEHLLNQELLGIDANDESAMQTGLSDIEAKLIRARRILNERPGTAHALILEALRRLDELAVASLDATRSI